MATRSLLAGKLFDETGDRLTPSHSRKNGKRLRCYISRRLVTDKSRKHPDAWRLPAPELEQAVLSATRMHLSGPASIAALVSELQVHEVMSLEDRLRKLLLDEVANKQQIQKLIAKVRVAPGELMVSLGDRQHAEALGVSPGRLVPECLTLTALFRLRRKGVETRIVIGEQLPELDRILVRNIVKARTWYQEICRGMSFADIAEREGVSRRRVQDLIDLAFLSPVLLDRIAVAAFASGVLSKKPLHQ